VKFFTVGFVLQVREELRHSLYEVAADGYAGVCVEPEEVVAGGVLDVHFSVH